MKKKIFFWQSAHVYYPRAGFNGTMVSTVPTVACSVHNDSFRSRIDSVRSRNDSIRSRSTSSESAASATRRRKPTPLLDAAVRVGVDHLQPLGEASASLSLVATLVLGLCLTVLIDSGEALEETNDVELYTEGVVVTCLSCAAATSAHTLAFSLLELYYAKTVSGLDLSIARATTAAEGYARHLHNDAVESDRLRRRVNLASDVDRIYVAFSGRRRLALNSMWTSMICMLIAAAAKIVGRFMQPNCPWPFAIVACVMLLIGALSVPWNVLSFRRQYWPLMAWHSEYHSESSESQRRSSHRAFTRSGQLEAHCEVEASRAAGAAPATDVDDGARI
eukprot:916206-Prymnesium_polylepis.1